MQINSNESKNSKNILKFLLITTDSYISIEMKVIKTEENEIYRIGVSNKKYQSDMKRLKKYLKTCNTFVVSDTDIILELFVSCIPYSSYI
jgi:hypothetical protein